jgi:hypothetical protein
MMLIMSSILNLKTRQVDYTQAFPQATLDDPVFMQIPQGWYVKEDNLYQHSNPKHNDTTHYMRLKRNLYGCKQAARNWFQHLTKGLLQLGFVQSRTDSCLFLRHDCILVVYVDDCLIFAEINTLSASYLLQDERDVNAFLGIKINKVTTKKIITLTQPSLIQQILKEVSITERSNGKYTPVDSILYADVDGLDRIDTWNYRSIVGKLNYLVNNTRPDISVAVHQCAQFCSHPKAIHELAVKRLTKYLLTTQHKGLILRPTTDMHLNMYVDADFAGRWHQEYTKL